jgi:hypothetical protein
MMTSAMRWLFLVLLILASPAQAASERTSALEASQGQYAVVAPIFRSGPTGLTSFIRLVNNAGIDTGTEFTATTYTINVVGATSGTIYGVATIPVAAHASPQYSIDEILTEAKAAPLAGEDTGYALYIQTPHLGTGFMHVIYNGVTGFFENVSSCQAYVDADAETKHLFNVHTSVISTYPSQIYIHNYAATAVTYRVTVRDARTGLTVGTTDVATTANSTISMPFSAFEQLLSWTPLPSQQHVNMMFEAIGIETAPVLVSTFVTYQGALVSMTAICQVNDIFDSGVVGDGDGDGGGDGSGNTTFKLTVTKAGTGTGSVTSSPTGIECGALCPNRSFDFNSGTQVSLTATPAGGATFQGWGGACSGTTTCNVTMSEARNVTATFGPVVNSLTVSTVGNGNVVSTPTGINCGTMGTACTFGFGLGNTVSLQALGQGSTLQGFLGWSGCSSTSGNSNSICNVVISGAQNVTATFAN